MEAMLKNENEDKEGKKELPSWMESLRLVFRAFTASPTKTSKLDQQLKKIQEQTDTELEYALFTNNRGKTSKKSGSTLNKGQKLADKPKIEKIEPVTKVKDSKELDRDER